MTSKPLLYIDYDMTLVDTCTPVLKRFHEITGVQLTSREIRHWTYLGDTYGDEFNLLWTSAGIYNSIEPLPYSDRFIEEVSKCWNPVIITATPAYLQEEKSRHIIKHFNLPFIHTHEKWEYTLDHILIDDGPHNIIDTVKYNRTESILFNLNNDCGWSYIDSQDELIKRAYSYKIVLAILDSLRGKYV